MKKKPKTVAPARECEVCFRLLKNRQDRFCSKPCQYIGRWANRDAKEERRGLIRRFWLRVKKGRGCWLWVGNKTPKGYGTIGFNKKDIYAHRLAWELKHGPIPVGKWVLHSCDTANCVRHLFLGTPKDNSEDMVAKDRSTRGIRHPFAKLTEASVIYIKKNFEPGNGFDLARKFMVSRSAITSIVHGRNWRHVR